MYIGVFTEYSSFLSEQLRESVCASYIPQNYTPRPGSVRSDDRRCNLNPEEVWLESASNGSPAD